MVPPTAVTVKVETPAVTVVAPVSVRTVEPAPGAAIVAEENPYVTPGGNPLTEKLTGKLKLFVRVPVVKVMGTVPGVVTVE